MFLPSTNQYVGKLLTCEPYYGFGWYRLDTEDYDIQQLFETVLGPPSADHAPRFQFRLNKLLTFGGKSTAFVGRIEDEHPLFSNLFIMGWTMIIGEFDFTGKVCGRIDLNIGPELPSTPDAPMSSGAPIFTGCGWIAASSEWIDNYKQNR